MSAGIYWRQLSGVEITIAKIELRSSHTQRGMTSQVCRRIVADSESVSFTSSKCIVKEQIFMLVDNFRQPVGPIFTVVLPRRPLWPSGHLLGLSIMAKILDELLHTTWTSGLVDGSMEHYGHVYSPLCLSFLSRTK